MSWDRDCAIQCGRTYDVAAPRFIGFGKSSVVADIGGADLFGSNLVVCFRGSKEVLDWLLDFMVVPAADNASHNEYAKMGPVHSGFLLGALALLPAIKTAVTGKPYSLTGHSLGGALALLTGALMSLDGHPPTQIVTFGSPKVGFQPFVDVLSHIDVREYKFGADPVPLVPEGYDHARLPIHLGKPVRDLFANHSIVNYIGAFNG